MTNETLTAAPSEDPFSYLIETWLSRAELEKLLNVLDKHCDCDALRQTIKTAAHEAGYRKYG